MKKFTKTSEKFYSWTRYKQHAPFHLLPRDLRTMDYTAWNDTTQCLLGCAHETESSARKRPRFHSGGNVETLSIVDLTEVRSQHFSNTSINHLPWAD